MYFERKTRVYNIFIVPCELGTVTCSLSLTVLSRAQNVGFYLENTKKKIDYTTVNGQQNLFVFLSKLTMFQNI